MIIKVYVVEEGVYNERAITGVYGSLQAAKDAVPIPDSPRHRESLHKGWVQHDDGWRESPGGGAWNNGCDFAEAADIGEYEVEVRAGGAASSTSEDSFGARVASLTAEMIELEGRIERIRSEIARLKKPDSASSVRGE